MWKEEYADKYFNPRSPCGERPQLRPQFWITEQFQSTLPVWGATLSPVVSLQLSAYFNPRSPCGERRAPYPALAPPSPEFQSTLPVWGATYVRKGWNVYSTISIHAPRVGSDLREALEQITNWDFNPRSPCGERRISPSSIYRGPRFQSTLPVWGATTAYSSVCSNRYNFNPRSPCGERPENEAVMLDGQVFQSTLPVWGATPGASEPQPGPPFQSTLPVWGATFRRPKRFTLMIGFQSTLPVWGATRPTSAWRASRTFQSTLPVWGATKSRPGDAAPGGFQSTLPVWGATGAGPGGPETWAISIHAPRVGSDCTAEKRVNEKTLISIHAPRVGSDRAFGGGQHGQAVISIHAPRVGSDITEQKTGKRRRVFQSTLPVWGATLSGPV